MGIFAIASHGRRIGIQGWSQQNGAKNDIIKKFTKSKESVNLSGVSGRILQRPNLTEAGGCDIFSIAKCF